MPEREKVAWAWICVSISLRSLQNGLFGDPQTQAEFLAGDAPASQPIEQTLTVESHAPNLQKYGPRTFIGYVDPVHRIAERLRSGRFLGVPGGVCGTDVVQVPLPTDNTNTASLDHRLQCYNAGGVTLR